MFKSILSYFFFIPKFFPYIKNKKKIRPYFGLPKRNYGGPNIRTKKMIESFGNYLFSPNIIYAQSWWEEKELKDALQFSKKHNIPIVFNQNGWFYKAWYKKNWRKRNQTLIKIHKASKKVIYQSKFCKSASYKLTNYINKNNSIIYNPSLIRTNKQTKKILNKNNKFNIIVTGVFGEESRHILLPILKSIDYLDKKNLSSLIFKVNIYGVIKENMKKSNWFSEYKKLYDKLSNKGLAFYNGSYDHKNLHNILKNVNLAIHIKYKDPCPNAVIEKLQYGIPHVYSKSGGTPELIGNSGLSISVKDVWDKMVEVNYKSLSKKIVKISNNYKIYNFNALKQGKKFSYLYYVLKHKKIFKRLIR